MKAAFTKLVALTDGGKLTQGYRLFFKSTAFLNNDDDTEEAVMGQLDKCLEEIKSLRQMFRQNGTHKRQLHPERKYVIILPEIPLVV